MSAELSFMDPGGDRLAVVVRVERDGIWTPGPHVSIDSGNQLELTLAELSWLVTDAGPAAIAELQALFPNSAPDVSFQAGVRPDTGEPSRPSSPPEREPGLTAVKGSRVAGQGASTRPEPAKPSKPAEEA